MCSLYRVGSMFFIQGGFQVLSSLSPCRHVPSVFPSQFSHIVLERVPGDWDIKRFRIAKFAGLEIKNKNGSNKFKSSLLVAF